MCGFGRKVDLHYSFKVAHVNGREGTDPEYSEISVPIAGNRLHYPTRASSHVTNGFKEA